MGVDGLLNGLHPDLLSEVVRPQQAEVVVRIDVVQGQDQVDQRLATAAKAVTAHWTRQFAQESVCSRVCVAVQRWCEICVQLSCRVRVHSSSF